MKQLTRKELRKVSGGVFGSNASCTAICSSTYSVTCTGATCTATDGIGCTASTTGSDGNTSHDDKTCYVA